MASDASNNKVKCDHINDQKCNPDYDFLTPLARKLREIPHTDEPVADAPQYDFAKKYAFHSEPILQEIPSCFPVLWQSTAAFWAIGLGVGAGVAAWRYPYADPSEFLHISRKAILRESFRLMFRASTLGAVMGGSWATATCFAESLRERRDGLNSVFGAAVSGLATSAVTMKVSTGAQVFAFVSLGALAQWGAAGSGSWLPHVQYWENIWNDKSKKTTDYAEKEGAIMSTKRFTQAARSINEWMESTPSYSDEMKAIFARLNGQNRTYPFMEPPTDSRPPEEKN